MVLEQAILAIQAGHEADYEAALVDALPIIRAAEGCEKATVSRGVERPGVYVLHVEWSSLEAHAAFRETEAFQQWRALLSPHYDGTPSVEHFAPTGK